MEAITIIAYVLDAIIVVMLIKTIQFRVQTKRTLKKLDAMQKGRDESFANFTKNMTERINILAKENVKLRQRNEAYQNYLKELGIKDLYN